MAHTGQMRQVTPEVFKENSPVRVFPVELTGVGY